MACAIITSFLSCYDFISISTRLYDYVRLLRLAISPFFLTVPSRHQAFGFSLLRGAASYTTTTMTLDALLAHQLTTVAYLSSRTEFGPTFIHTRF